MIKDKTAKNKIIITTLAAMIALGACAAPGEQNPLGMGNKQTIGGLGGAVLGGLAGASMGKGRGRLWTTGAGVLVGTLVGSEIGKSLDRTDRIYNERAWDRAYAAPLNSRISWNNPDNGHGGYIVPIREGTSSAGYPCREYKQTIVVDGRAETAYGTACQNPDGRWGLSNY